MTDRHRHAHKQSIPLTISLSPNPCPLELHATVTIDSHMLLDDIQMAIREDLTYLRFLEMSEGLEPNR